MVRAKCAPSLVLVVIPNAMNLSNRAAAACEGAAVATSAAAGLSYAAIPIFPCMYAPLGPGIAGAWAAAAVCPAAWGPAVAIGF